jgi:hypothetical protein
VLCQPNPPSYCLHFLFSGWKRSWTWTRSWTALCYPLHNGFCPFPAACDHQSCSISFTNEQCADADGYAFRGKVRYYVLFCMCVPRCKGLGYIYCSCSWEINSATSFCAINSQHFPRQMCPYLCLCCSDSTTLVTPN